MPRKPRELANSRIYHVMTRTFPGGKLFYDDNDKEVMLKILRKLMIEIGFEVYTYCLMDNHTHFLFNVKEANISEIMKKFNLRYGAYLRGAGKHHGPIFRGRFNSKAVENERYLIEVSKYIHKNPVDIAKYKNNPEKYRFSSLAVFLGIRKDEFNICNEDYIIKLLGCKKNKAIKAYYKEIFKCDKYKLQEVEFESGNCEYRSEKVTVVREMSMLEIEDYLCSQIKINKQVLHIKYLREYKEYKAIFILLLSRFASKSIKEITGYIGNITNTTISKLCKYGVDLICKEKIYEDILNKFINDNKLLINL